MDTIIKIDLQALYEQYLTSLGIIFDVDVENNFNGTYTVENFTGNFVEIVEWFKIRAMQKQKEYEDDLIEHLKNDNLQYVIERL